MPVGRTTVTADVPEPSPPTGEPHCAHSTVCSRPLCYRAATDADQPRAATAPPTGARGPTEGTNRHPHRPDRRHRPPLHHPQHRPPRGRRSRVRRWRVQLLRVGSARPATALTDLEFEQQTIIYDRTGKVELARLGELKREVVTFSSCPARSSTPRRRSRTRTSGAMPGSIRSASSRPVSTPCPASPAGHRSSPGLGLALDRGRARDDHRAHAVGDVVAGDHGGGGAQVLDARIRARADEYAIDRDVGSGACPGVTPM